MTLDYFYGQAGELFSFFRMNSTKEDIFALSQPIV